jgi:hypothetical protein
MIEILSPVWTTAERPTPPKRRPRTLVGTNVAFVDDNLDTPFTTHLETLLAERVQAKVRRHVKPSGTAPSPAALIEQASDAAVAIVGIGL